MQTHEPLLIPAKTAADLFAEKVASAISRMPDDEKKWPQHIQSELMRELPFLAQYDIDIVLDRSEPEAGAALGYVQVRNKTMSRPQDNISTPGNILRIPIIVQERRLQKFYIFEAGGQTYPLTEDRVQQAMLNPAVFDTDATRVPASSSLIDQLYPPYQQRQGFGRVTEPAAMGLSKLSSAPQKQAPAVKTANAYQRLSFLVKLAYLTPEEIAMYDAYSGDPGLAARHLPATAPAATPAAPAAGPKVIVQPGTGEASRRLQAPATPPPAPAQVPATAAAGGGGGAGVPPRPVATPAAHAGGGLPVPHGGGEMVHVPASPLARVAPAANEAGHAAGALRGRLGLAALGTGALLGGAALLHHRRQQAAAQQPEKTVVASSPYERFLHTSKVAVSFGAQDNGAGGAEEWKGRLSDMEGQVAAEQQAAADQQVMAAQQQAAGAGGAGAGGGQKKTDGKDVAIDRLTGTLQEEMRHRHGIEKALLESATGINIDTGSTQARAPAQQEQAAGAVPAAAQEAPVQEAGAPATAGAQSTAMPEPTSAYEKLSAATEMDFNERAKRTAALYSGISGGLGMGPLGTAFWGGFMGAEPGARLPVAAGAVLGQTAGAMVAPTIARTLHAPLGMTHLVTRGLGAGAGAYAAHDLLGGAEEPVPPRSRSKKPKEEPAAEQPAAEPAKEASVYARLSSASRQTLSAAFGH